MKKVLIFVTFSLIYSCSTMTQKERDREILITPKKPEDVTAKDINNYPEIFLNEESALQEFDDNKGIFKEALYTGLDTKKVTLSINYSQDYEDPTKVQTVDAAFWKRFENEYEQMWWGLQFKRTVAKYSAIAEESVNNTDIPRKDKSQQISMLGFGFGHRFKGLAGTLNSERFFEFISAYGNIVYHVDTAEEKKYQGYGYTAEYNLSYRYSDQTSLGTKLSYNWALVERPEDGDESLEERSLVFGWLTLGFEIGFYF